MALVNALLVRFANGFTWVSDAGSITTHGRREGFLSLGAAGSATEAERIATAVVDQRADPQVAVTASIEPLSGVIPYTDFAIGDHINVPNEAGVSTSMRVLALTVTEDEEGNEFYVPQLQTLNQEREESLNRWLKAMSNGTLGGSVASASAAPYAGPGINGDAFGGSTGVGGGVIGTDGGPGSAGIAATKEKSFGMGGAGTAVAAGESGPWYPLASNVHIVRAVVAVDEDNLPTANITVVIHGDSDETVTLGTGDATAYADVDTSSGTGAITVECTNPGTGATGLTVTLEYEEV